MTIRIQTIDPSKQRYPTLGDYYPIEGGIVILVSKQKDPRYEKLIALHELVEWWLSEQHGIPEPHITAYDLQWEERLKMGTTTADEPGNEPDCPYKDIHRIAENFERLLARELQIDWHQYSNELTLGNEPERQDDSMH